MLRKVSYLKDEAPMQRKPIKSHPAFLPKILSFAPAFILAADPAIGDVTGSSPIRPDMMLPTTGPLIRGYYLFYKDKFIGGFNV